MALTRCRDCGRQISKRASACPNCGAPSKRTINTLVGLVVIAILVPLICGGLLTLSRMGAVRDNGVIAPAPPRKVAEVAADMRRLSEFTKVYPPDGYDSTEDDVPRPPLITKWAIYKAESVHVTAMPAEGWKIGQRNPGGEWTIVTMTDSRTHKTIPVSECMTRLAGRKRQ